MSDNTYSLAAELNGKLLYLGPNNLYYYLEGDNFVLAGGRDGLSPANPGDATIYAFSEVDDGYKLFGISPKGQNIYADSDGRLCYKDNSGNYQYFKKRISKFGGANTDISDKALRDGKCTEEYVTVDNYLDSKSVAGEPNDGKGSINGTNNRKMIIDGEEFQPEKINTNVKTKKESEKIEYVVTTKVADSRDGNITGDIFKAIGITAAGTVIYNKIGESSSDYYFLNGDEFKKITITWPAGGIAQAGDDQFCIDNIKKYIYSDTPDGYELFAVTPGGQVIYTDPKTKLLYYKDKNGVLQQITHEITVREKGSLGLYIKSHIEVLNSENYNTGWSVNDNEFYINDERVNRQELGQFTNYELKAESDNISYGLVTTMTLTSSAAAPEVANASDDLLTGTIELHDDDGFVSYDSCGDGAVGDYNFEYNSEQMDYVIDELDKVIKDNDELITSIENEIDNMKNSGAWTGTVYDKFNEKCKFYTNNVLRDYVEILRQMKRNFETVRDNGKHIDDAVKSVKSNVTSD